MVGRLAGVCNHSEHDHDNDNDVDNDTDDEDDDDNADDDDDEDVTNSLKGTRLHPRLSHKRFSNSHLRLHLLKFVKRNIFYPHLLR
jgi:hypothetical protein